jgi:hypothetical protein
MMIALLTQEWLRLESQEDPDRTLDRQLEIEEILSKTVPNDWEELQAYCDVLSVIALDGGASPYLSAMVACVREAVRTIPKRTLLA